MMSQIRTRNLSADWRVVLGFWVLIVIVYVTRAVLSGETLPLISDTDDAMRLNVIADWMAGQPWYDHTQYRLNTPFGADIHWSRLVDIPIATLIVVLQPFFGATAITIAAWIWPLLLLVALLYLSVGLSVHLAGPQAVLPGLVLPVLSAAVLVEFAPGRVDHHNIQIVLTLALLYASVLAWKKPLWALVAGLAAATSLAIGMEALPQIAAAVTVFGLFWVIEEKKGSATRLFGIGFALSSLVQLLLALPPSRWFVPACDALSIVHFGAAFGVGIVFLILPLLSLKTWWSRLASGAVLGVAMVAILLIIFPQCRGGPYAAVDPWLVEKWLSQIIEAKPAWFSFSALPAFTLGIVVPPLLALAGVVWIARTKPVSTEMADKRAEWLILGLFLLVGIAVMLVQIRGARLVAGMIAPVGAYAIIAARQRYLNRKKLLDVVALLGTWLVFSGLAVAVVAGYALPRGGDEPPLAGRVAFSKNACLQPEAFASLASLSAMRIMAPVDLGAHLLLYTPHSVVGAPYHRNVEGLRDTFDFFNLPIEQARSILERRGISTIVTCPAMPEMRGFSDAPDTAFVNLVTAGNLPDWIVEISSPDTPLKIYAVQD